jgi:RNA polymerase sigma-70 factor (ECF subfamily)
MASPGDRSLFDLWCGGNEQAARALFERYAERLVALARRRLGQRMARRVDAEDIVQSVFRTFFTRAKEGQFAIQAQDDLCKLLFRLTVVKTLRQMRHHRAAKRNLGQEVEPGREMPAEAESIDPEPNPEAINAFLDQLEHFLRQLRPEERQILEMRMQGFGTAEIAKQLGTYERKVFRLLERIRGLAEREELTP